jgi:hypothetical protein
VDEVIECPDEMRGREADDEVGIVAVELLHHRARGLAHGM